jgi:hypothetical protein
MLVSPTSSRADTNLALPTAERSDLNVAQASGLPEQSEAERKKMSDELDQAVREYKIAEAALRRQQAGKPLAPTTKILFKALDSVGNAIKSLEDPKLLDVYRGTKGAARLDLYRAAADIRKAIAIDNARLSQGTSIH